METRRGGEEKRERKEYLQVPKFEHAVLSAPLASATHHTGGWLLSSRAVSAFLAVSFVFCLRRSRVQHKLERELGS